MKEEERDGGKEVRGEGRKEEGKRADSEGLPATENENAGGWCGTQHTVRIC